MLLVNHHYKKRRAEVQWLVGHQLLSHTSVKTSKKTQILTVIFSSHAAVYSQNVPVTNQNQWASTWVWGDDFLLSFSNHVTSNGTVMLKRHSPCASSLGWAAHPDPAKEMSVKDYQANTQTHTQMPAFLFLIGVLFFGHKLFIYVTIRSFIPQIWLQKGKYICEWLCVLELFSWRDFC